MTNKSIYKGDDTNAFGNNFVRIIVSNPDQRQISKIVFSVNGGLITKEFTDECNFTAEEIELVVNFNSTETAQLSGKNVGNVYCFDMHNRQYTCRQSLIFSAINGVICKNG